MKRAAIVVGVLGLVPVLLAVVGGHPGVALGMASVLGLGVLAGLLWAAPERVSSGPPRTRTHRYREVLTHWERDQIRAGICPDCAVEASLLEGPSGGNCVNLTCRECGSRFNVAQLLGELPWGERLNDRSPV